MSVPERAVLEEALRRVRSVPSRQDIIRDGDSPADSTVLLEGFACRYKILTGGKRQILSFLVPGDICDLQLMLLERMDHAVVALTLCRVATLPRKSIENLCETSPRMLRTLWRDTQVDAAILREWIACLGRRSPYERVAHLFCELACRLHAVGLAEAPQFEFPATQADLGDALGLSVVHVNRTLQQMRADDLITLRANLLTILDWDRLVAAGRFTPDYLSLGSKPGLLPK